MKPNYRRYYRYLSDQPYFLPPAARLHTRNVASAYIPKLLLNEGFTSLYTAPLVAGYAIYSTYKNYLEGRQLAEKQEREAREKKEREMELIELQKQGIDSQRAIITQQESFHHAVMDRMKSENMMYAQLFTEQLADIENRFDTLIDKQQQLMAGLYEGYKKMITTMEDAAESNQLANLQNEELKKSIDKMTTTLAHVTTGDIAGVPRTIYESLSLLEDTLIDLKNDLATRSDESLLMKEAILDKMDTLKNTPSVIDMPDLTKLIASQEDINNKLAEMVGSTKAIVKKLAKSDKVGQSLLGKHVDALTDLTGAIDKQEITMKKINSTLENIALRPVESQPIPAGTSVNIDELLNDPVIEQALIDVTPPQPAQPEPAKPIERGKIVKIDGVEYELPKISITGQLPTGIEKRYVPGKITADIKEKTDSVNTLIIKYNKDLQSGVDENFAKDEFMKGMTDIYGMNVLYPQTFIGHILLNPHEGIPSTLHPLFSPKLRYFLNNPTKVAVSTAAERLGKKRVAKPEADRDLYTAYLKRQYMKDMLKARNVSSLKELAKTNPAKAEEIKDEYNKFFFAAPGMN